MKSAVELPVNYLEMSDLFDFDFVIASTCLEFPKYKEFYLSEEHRSKSRFMILDNGAFEKGEAIEDKEYLDLARELKPNVLVIPDKVNDPHTTLMRYNIFMQAWKANPIENCELMGVIHSGGTIHTAHIMGAMYYSNGIQWIGIPYFASGLDRYSLIKANPEWPNVHILGLPTLPEALSLQMLPNVRSCDSSLPVKCANNHARIEVAMSSALYADIDIEGIDKHLLKNNLEIFTATCNGNVRITRL